MDFVNLFLDGAWRMRILGLKLFQNEFLLFQLFRHEYTILNILLEADQSTFKKKNLKKISNSIKLYFLVPKNGKPS